MVADGEPGQVERRGQVTDADLTALVRTDQGGQPDPGLAGSKSALNACASPTAALPIGSRACGVKQASMTSCELAAGMTYGMRCPACIDMTLS